GLVLVTLYALLTYRQVIYFYREILKAIRMKLPGRFIDDPKELENELVATVNNAKELHLLFRRQV
ncbi:MAG: hypothetical protein RMI79_06260, partial [Nitrososphaerota archaeon]|nr:hypothetical protein [Nitrososphaerota archaeon]